MKREPAPSLGLSTLLTVLLAAAWTYLRVVAFQDTVLPLSYVIPLLLGVWTQRKWQVWGMAGVFVVAAASKVIWFLPADMLTAYERAAYLGATIFNILAGAALVHLIVRLRVSLGERNALLMAQNSELEAQSEELAQQNEEIKAQSEELVHQNEEIEAQSEELTRQNEELQETAERLTHREEVLQALLESTRTPESGRHALLGICRRALGIFGEPAECVAVLKTVDSELHLKVQASVDGGPTVPFAWPMAGSIGGVVLTQDKTAYISDLAQEPALAAPFGTDSRVRSMLAAPMRIAAKPYGMVVACSTRSAHWTQEQFRIIEWIAAQCGLIAEALRWQTALADRAREIEAANRSKDEFLAMLSHELRTPLTPVLAAAGVLEHDPRIPAEIRSDLAMISRNIAIQSRLIDDLLDLTKLGRGKVQLDLRVLDLAALLRETTTIVGPDLDAKDQTLVVELPSNRRLQVMADAPRLQQVFWNLLKNANKYSPANSEIRLVAGAAAGPDARVAVEISDSGIGIDGPDLNRIFLPFEQAATGSKRRGNDAGLGLGLAIAKAIVELHGGTIKVSSEGIGRGAVFTVELPLAQDAAPARHPAPAVQGRAAAAGGRQPLQILLVEDHGDTGRILTRLLRNAGYKVELAETAGAAYQKFIGSHFDLVISDLGLPDESGVDLMRRLRTERPDLLGICLSGYGMENDLQACREAGFVEHLTKPVDMSRLHAAINRTCSELTMNN